MKHHFPDDILNKNGQVGILLVGAGGTGSQLLSGLARMHFALGALDNPGFDVIVCDPDTISAANVGRQLFSPADIGRNKAECLVTRVNRFFGLDWGSSAKRAENVKGAAVDILITAVDSAKARKAVSGNFREATYWLDTGNTSHTGQVVLGTIVDIPQPVQAGTVQHLPTVLDLYPDMERQDTSAKQGPSCSVAQALERQDLFINQMVATCALQLLWSAFRKGYLTEHGVFVNLNPVSVRPLPVDPEAWKRMGWPAGAKKEGKRKK